MTTPKSPYDAIADRFIKVDKELDKLPFRRDAAKRRREEERQRRKAEERTVVPTAEPRPVPPIPDSDSDSIPVLGQRPDQGPGSVPLLGRIPPGVVPPIPGPVPTPQPPGQPFVPPPIDPNATRPGVPSDPLSPFLDFLEAKRFAFEPGPVDESPTRRALKDIAQPGKPGTVLGDNQELETAIDLFNLGVLPFEALTGLVRSSNVSSLIPGVGAFLEPSPVPPGRVNPDLNVFEQLVQYEQAQPIVSRIGGGVLTDPTIALPIAAPTRIGKAAIAGAGRAVETAGPAIRSLGRRLLATGEEGFTRIPGSRVPEELGAKINARISELETALAKPGRLPQGMGTRKEASEQLGRAKADSFQAEMIQSFDNQDEMLGAIRRELENASEELTARNRPFHAGKPALFPNIKVAELEGYALGLDDFVRELDEAQAAVPASVPESIPAAAPDIPPIPDDVLAPRTAVQGGFGIGEPVQQGAFDIGGRGAPLEPLIPEEQIAAQAERARLLGEGPQALPAETAAAPEALPPPVPEAPLAQTPGIPPEPPSVPPVTTAAPIPPEGGDIESVITKLSSLIKEARPIQRSVIRANKLAKSEELSRRVGRAASVLDQSELPAREALRRSEGQLAGELPSPVFESIEPGLSATEITSIFENIKGINAQYFDKVNLRVAMERVLAGELPSPSELRNLENAFGRDFVNALRGKRGLGPKVYEQLLDVLNLPRQFLTSYDVSAPLRQGVVLLPGHPGKWAASVSTMMKALVREKNALAVEAAIRNDPNYLRFTGRHEAGSRFNLFIADLTRGGRGISGQEELFMSRLAEKIPGVRASQRAYVTFLNKLRMDVMLDIVGGWEKSGHPVTANDLDQLAIFLNNATGRGDLGKLNNLAPVLNIAFFAPRLLASRVQVPFSVASSSVLVRKQAAKDLSLFIGTGIMVLSLASLAGAKVELDPRSSDFGKIRMGNTSIEFWGGFQPIARYGAQFIMGQRKTVAGKNRGDIVSTPRGSTFVRFLRSKLSPPGALAADLVLFEQQDFLGNPVLGGQKKFLGKPYGESLPKIDALKHQSFNRLVPLFIQDLTDAFQDEGILGVVKVLPAGLGTGAVTFDRGETEQQKEITQPVEVQNDGTTQLETRQKVGAGTR